MFKNKIIIFYILAFHDYAHHHDDKMEGTHKQHEESSTNDREILCKMISSIIISKH